MTMLNVCPHSAKLTIGRGFKYLKIILFRKISSLGYGDGDGEGGAAWAHLVGVLLDHEVIVGGRDDGRPLLGHSVLAHRRLQPRGRGLEAVRASVRVQRFRRLGQVINRALQNIVLVSKIFMGNNSLSSPSSEENLR